METSRSGRTLYFNGLALARASGGYAFGNYVAWPTGDAYWVSGVKKDGSDRHWAGSGPITVEAAAVDEYLRLRRLTKLNPHQYVVSDRISKTDVAKHHDRANETLYPR